MIERTVIDGRDATVAYLKGSFQPAGKQDHTFIKVIFDDGTVMFATKEKAHGHDKIPH